jgi:choline dehydrogenase
MGSFREPTIIGGGTLVAMHDVAIVGAGSAGCVLAARLSQDPSCAVTLLEAGPDYPDPATLPPEIASGRSPAFTHDWGYRSEPGALGRALDLYRGRLVGGCSATNAAFALRGAPSDYDEWAALGNPGWSFAEVLPFFCRLERDLDAKADDRWHGQEGPLPIRRAGTEELGVVHRAFLDACVAAGYRQVSDHNAPGAIGAGPAPVNTVDGIRQSTALTYLAQARTRPNLTIRSGALVDRLVVEGGRVVGVRLTEPDETLLAERVILAAGTFGSPAILLRSGVGPAAELAALGIPVETNRPGVGANLVDHPGVGVVFTTSTPAQAGAPLFQAILTVSSAPAAANPDLHIALGHRPGEAAGDPAIAWLWVALLKPRSRGRLRLRSADPAAAPIIDLGLLDHPDDLAGLLAGVRAARRLARTNPLAALLGEERYPGAAVADNGLQLAAAVRADVNTYFHPVGACRMGRVDDPWAVVDPQGRVHGIDGLWVVDASIMPTIPAANTNLPTIMVAERCAA